MIGYNFDANFIKSKALKNREAKTIGDLYLEFNEYFANAGVKPNTWVMDNETSKQLKNALQKEKMTHQLVPAYSHRSNAAERAIQTWKNHFKTGLALVDPKFPIKEWDRLLPQCDLSLNLLRSSRINPKISAHAYMEGAFNYNKTPLVPPGMKVVAHEAPEKTASWAPNGEEAWTIGPARTLLLQQVFLSPNQSRAKCQNGYLFSSLCNCSKSHHG